MREPSGTMWLPTPETWKLKKELSVTELKKPDTSPFGPVPPLAVLKSPRE